MLMLVDIRKSAECRGGALADLDVSQIPTQIE